jgi:Domain of unknown function (DUF4331)
MSDHHDHAVAEHDITDLYVFRKPGDPTRAVLVMDVYPEAPPDGATFSTEARYEFAIDSNGDCEEDIVFRVVFSRPEGTTQRAEVQRWQRSDGSAGFETLIRDAVVSVDEQPHITTEGPFAFFAGIRSDPFFVDVPGVFGGFQWTRVDSMTSANVLAIVLEVPHRAMGNGSSVGVWARVLIPHDGAIVQADRAGRPFVNGVFNGGDEEAQNEFNQSSPKADRQASLGRFAIAVHRFGTFSPDEARAVAERMLPDLLPYTPSTETAYPNGRALTDDIADWTWALITNGAATDDGIGPHTDLLSGFPYLGPPHPAL